MLQIHAILPDSKLSLIHNSMLPEATLDSGKDRPLSGYLLLQGIMKSPLMSFISFNRTASDIKYKSYVRYITILQTLGTQPLRVSQV